MSSKILFEYKVKIFSIMVDRNLVYQIACFQSKANSILNRLKKMKIFV